MTSVSRRLANLASLFKQRHNVYGRDYEQVGEVLHGFFPNGLTLDTSEKFRRFYMFTFLLSKLNRYSQCLARGEGHSDSLKDLAVYAMMLNQLDEEE